MTFFDYSSRSRSAAAARCLLCLAAAAALCKPAGAAVSPAGDGWEMLWHNQNTAARAAFRAALHRNPANVEALRGLGLLAFEEDDPLAALQAWRPLYRLAPASPSAAAYWPRVVDLARRTGRWALLEGAARDVLAAHRAAPELRAAARLALADAAFRAGNLADAEAQWVALGSVRQWRVIGPFDNVSLSGFEKPFPPEREIDFSRTYPGKDDQTLHWHPLATVSRDGQCEVAASLGDEGANLFYAATALDSPRDQAALLRFDPTGAGKTYLNGRLVFSDAVYRQHQPLVAGPFRVPVTLKKGWNTLLIKLADDENSTAQFALRVTAPDGSDGLRLPADPARVTSHPADSWTATGAAAPSPGAEPVLVARLRQEAGHSEEAALALADTLRRAREYPAAIDALKAALVKQPASGWLHWTLSQTLQEDEQADEARAERDRARKLNSHLVAAELSFLADKLHALRAAERIERLKALRQISPGSSEVAWALAQAYGQAGLTSESLKSARAAVARAAGPEEIVRLAAFYEERDRTAEAQRTLATALRAAPNDETLLQGQVRLLEEGDQTAIPSYRRLLEVNPSGVTYRLRLAELYQAAGNPQAAIQALQAARRQRPQDAHVCALLADTLQEVGRSAEAIQLYRAAIQLAPAQVELREKLQVLAKERPIVDLVPATPTASMLATAPKAAEATGASSIVLLDETREVVYPDYARAARVHRIIRVLDAAAAEQYRQFPLSTNSASASATLETARLIKPDGKVQDAADNASGSSVAFPSLAPGDVIDVAFRVEDYPRGGLARQFWTEWYFSEPGTFVRLSRYVLITPPAMLFQMRSHGPVPVPAVKDVKGWRVREWRMADIPARKLEPLSPGVADTETWLDISTLTSWRQIVQWYQDLSRPRCVPDAAIRAKAVELTQNARTEEEKLRAVIAFVRGIQYQSTPFRLSAYVPTEGKQVIRERYGDCKDKAALLTALLACAGIKADMVLLSGRQQGITPFLPSPRFSHAIAVVQTATPDCASCPLWVDATADQMEFGDLPADDQQVPALVIDDATTDLALTPAIPVEKDRVVDTSTLALGTDGKLSGRFDVSATGAWGWILRSLLRRVPEGSRDQVLRGIATQITDNCRYESGSMDHLSDPDQPLTLGIQYHVDRYSSEAGSFLLVRLPWGLRMGGAENLLTDAQRQQDIETTGLRGDYQSSVRLELPAGYVPQDLQPEVHGESPWGSYRITYRMEGNVLHAESELKIAALRIAAKDSPQFLEFMRAVDKEAHRQFVLKKQ